MTSPWPPDLVEDYAAAAIRLVTVTEARIQHLLFAQVDLYPHEIQVPPRNTERQRKNFGDMTVSVGITVMPVADALAWYESALSGRLTVPGITTEIPIATLRLSPEPILGRLLISNDAPFVRAWHAGPRVHRLVPMDEIPELIEQFTSIRDGEPLTNIRMWVADRIGFDLLAHDDVLCGLVLAAPNPIVRGVNTYIKETRPDGGEVLGVKANLRQGASPSTLSIRLREERPGGTAFQDVRLDAFGMATVVLPQLCEQSGFQLVCDKRGVLSAEQPGHFFRSVSVTAHVSKDQGKVEVPPRRKGETARAVYLQALIKDRPGGPKTSAINAARRLNELQVRQMARTGLRRPDGFALAAEEDERIFLDDRYGAVAFVNSLVSRATREVIFVDSYFSHIDVREFALSTRYEGVSMTVLTGRDLLDSTKGEDGTEVWGGDIYFADLQKLEAELLKVGRVVPDVRLMGDTARNYHDRFLVVDDVVWHFGHSFNYIGGNELCMVTRMRHPNDIREFISEDVASAAKLLTDWPALKEKRLRDIQRQKMHEQKANNNAECAWCRKIKGMFTSPVSDDRGG